MNVPIFFFFYLIGHMLCAYLMELGVNHIRAMPSEEAWSYRSKWDWRLIMRFGRPVIAIEALLWPYIFLALVVDRIRDERNARLFPARVRPCVDLVSWCEPSEGDWHHHACRHIFQAIQPGCAPDWKMRMRGGIIIVHDFRPRCMFAFILDRGKCATEQEWRDIFVTFTVVN